MNVKSASTPSVMRTARDVLGLFKLRIGFMIMLTALVGLAVTSGPSLGWPKLLTLALAVLVSSASAGAFNQYYEHDSDRLMARTRGRAFVTGALARTPAWLILMGVMLAGSVTFAAWVLNPVSAAFVFLGAFFYAIVYTVWLKRRSALNIVVGGLAGSFAVLAGAAAVNPQLGPLPVLLAIVLFLWTPPHFWSLAIANQAEYAAAGIPMLPVVVGVARAAQIVLWSTVALALTALLPGLFGAGLIYLGGALAGGGYFVYRAWLLARAPSRKTAMGAFFASLIQLSLLLVGATFDSLLR
ncbi:MAG: protoheme IX farnesyltransferase [Burkholderiales bacterium RIFCSPHIGHO2_12_FULL_61_11]|nr:MAG: protoheme IX farnesyltransferase [Burkholderiales bacterium RIFCSPHIGHO2_12_FULL_61_11]